MIDFADTVPRVPFGEPHGGGIPPAPAIAACPETDAICVVRGYD